LRIDVLTLFPNMFTGFLNESIIKKAIDKKLIEINIINFRDYTPYKNNQVDDYSYGGGAGMVLMCEPIYNALENLKTKDSHIVILSPRGKTYNQSKAIDLKKYKHIILICGHYEGFDERIYSYADEIISIGDYILTGGELPSMCIIDSVVRLIDGVINKESLENESFNDDLLDFPVYTKPREFKGMKVPDVLISGDHKKIEEYRNEQRIKITKDKIKWNVVSSMKYAIAKTPNLKLNYYKVKINGLDIVPKNKISGFTIKAKKIVIADEELSIKFIKKRINKKIDKVLSFMISILHDEEGTTESDSTLVLDEISKLKSIIMNKYKEFLKEEEYKSFLTKLIILENEFKKNYNQKIMMGSIMNNIYYEEERRGRGI